MKQLRTIPIVDLRFLLLQIIISKLKIFWLVLPAPEKKFVYGIKVPSGIAVKPSK